MKKLKTIRKPRHHLPEDDDYEARMIAIRDAIDEMNEPNEIDRQDDDLMNRYFRQYLK